jgi:hypothetical protein
MTALLMKIAMIDGLLRFVSPMHGNIMIRSCMLLMLLAVPTWCEDVVQKEVMDPHQTGNMLVWTVGPGLSNANIKPKRIDRNGTVAMGELIAVGEMPARAHMVDMDVELIMSPGAIFSVSASTGASRDMIIDVERGHVQATLRDRRGWDHLIMRGYAMDVLVTGTTLILSRPQRDADYVAVIEGKVTARLRSHIAEYLRRQVPDVDLLGRQGISADKNGFGTVDSLQSRPQLPEIQDPFLLTIRDQAMIPQDSVRRWDLDVGRLVTDHMLTVRDTADALIDLVISHPVQDPWSQLYRDLEPPRLVPDPEVRLQIDDVRTQLDDLITKSIVEPSLDLLGNPPGGPQR